MVKFIIKQEYIICQINSDSNIKAPHHKTSYDSSSCSSNNISNVSAFMNKSNSSSHANELRKKRNLSKTNIANHNKKIETLNKSPKKFNNILNSEKKKSSSSSLDSNKFIKDINASHKSFKSATLNNNNEKKFQRNTEHTQSIKLIKENLANLFLSKKSNNKCNIIESNDRISTCSESTDKIAW